MDSERRRYAQETGRCAPRLPILPGSTSFPRKREPTGWRLAAESGNLLEAPAYAKAGTYPIAPRTHRAANAARPDPSTLSRRVRGVLSPYRERGNSALARRPLGRDSRLRGNDGKKGGNDGEEAGVTMKEDEMEASEREQARRPRRGATRPVSKPSPGPRHSRESGNLLEGRPPYAKAGTCPPAPAYAKRVPTGGAAPTAVPSPAAFAASSPFRDLCIT